MGLLDNILDNLLTPPDQERSSREFGPGLSAIAGATTPIGFASDAALAFNNNKFADFLGEDQKRRAQVLQMIQGIEDPQRRLELANQLQESRQTLEGTFATPDFGRVMMNSLGLLGSLGAGARVAGAGARGLGLAEPATTITRSGFGGFGPGVEKFANRTGIRTLRGDPINNALKAQKARGTARLKDLRSGKKTRFTKDKTGKFTGSK